MELFARRITPVISLCLLAAGCPRPTTQRGTNAPDSRLVRRPRGPSSMTPHNEMVSLGPYGADNNECGIMLYAWEPSSPRCRYQLNHCGRDPQSGVVSCLSLADERTVACGAQGDACGQSVRCDCPTGAAPVVQDPPNTVVIAPSADGGAWTSGAACSARVARLAGSGDASDEPCEISIHDCESPNQCVDRWETVSCNGRATVCGRSVRCECR